MPAPWAVSLRDPSGETRLDEGASPDRVLTVRAIDASAQESGRLLTWTGEAEGAFLISGPAVDLQRQATGDMAVAIRYRVEAAPTAPVFLAAGCGEACSGGVDIAPLLVPAATFQTLQIKLGCLRDAGADLSRTEAPVILTTSGALTLAVEDIRLVSNTGGAICPG